jgi:transposase
MFVRVVKGNGKPYVLIVRSFRDGEGKPRQRTVLNLGPVNDTNRDATVELAKRMIANLEGKQTIIDGTEIQETSRYNWGAVAILEQLWSRFSMARIIKGGKADALKLMLTDRLIAPSSKLGAYNNRHKYFGINDVDLNQMYRSLDYLADNVDDIKLHIYNKQKLCGVSDVVFFDVTTLYFESQKADLLRDFGYSKDCKFNEVQIVLCLLIDDKGKPISYELFAGNTFEGATLIPLLKRLQNQFGIKRLVIVADRGIGSKANLEAIKEAGYDYVIGAKLGSASKSIAEEAISEEGFKQLYCTADDSDSKKYKFIENGGQDWVILHSTKRQQKDMSDRARLIEKAEEMLSKGGIAANKRGARKFLKIEKAGQEAVSLDVERIEREAKFDGYYALSFSDKDLSAQEITRAYQGLWMIEESFRTLKSFFEVRPIFHWSKKRIEGHILMNFLLLVMENYLLTACQNEGLKLSHNKLRGAIKEMEVSEIKMTSIVVASYAAIDDEQRLILKAMNIPLPKNYKIQL